MDCLKEVAPSIVFLGLLLDPPASDDQLAMLAWLAIGDDRPAPTFPVLQLLPYFSQLSGLYIEARMPPKVLEVLKHLPSSSLRSLFLSHPTYGGKPLFSPWPHRIDKALDLLSLKNLRRLRLYSSLTPMTPTKEWADLTKKCEERGIELRDERRFFTGA